MSISPELSSKTHWEYVVIQTADIAEFAKEVQQALNSAWELCGSAYAAYDVKDGTTQHFQPMKRRAYTKH